MQLFARPFPLGSVVLLSPPPFEFGDYPVHLRYVAVQVVGSCQLPKITVDHLIEARAPSRGDSTRFGHQSVAD